MFHSKFQQDNFITKRAGGTLYGQYKQSLRELATRISSLKQSYYQREKLSIDIEELQNKIESAKTKWFKAPSAYKIARWELTLKQKVMQLEESVRTVAETEREFKRFYSQAVYLRQLLIDKHGELTTEVKEQLDRDMWLFKTKEAIAIDLVAHRGLLNTTYEMIVSLPDNMKKEVFNEFKNGDLLSWYEQNDNDYFKEGIPQLEMDDIKQLLKQERLLLE